MANEPRPEGSIRVTDDEIGGFRIAIQHPKYQGDAVGCLIPLSLAWVFMGFAGICGFAGGSWTSGVSLMFLTAWFLMGAVVCFGVLSVLVVQSEVITICDDQMVIYTEWGPFHSSRAFHLGKVRNLQYSNEFKGVEFLPDGKFPVVFGVGLPKDTCHRLIKTLRDRFKLPDDLAAAEPFPVEPD